MDLDLKETFKFVFVVIGVALMVYQAFAEFTSNAPLRQVVNPNRRQLLVAGIALISLGYSTLAIIAGNKWAPAEVWTVVAPLFNEQPTPLKVVATVFVGVVGGSLLVGSTFFCFIVYPRDPKSFTPSSRNPAAIRSATDDALYHYTTRRGGLEYAAVIVLPADGSIPTVEQLIATVGQLPANGYYLIECLDRWDARKRDKENEKQKATRKELVRRAGGWLALALESQPHLRELDRRTVTRNFGGISQTCIRSGSGGMTFEYLLPINTTAQAVITYLAAVPVRRGAACGD